MSPGLADEPPLLDVSGLRARFGDRLAVDGVSLSVNRGGALALVGESGCGKSTLALSLVRLVPPPGRVVEGSVCFEGRDLLTLSDEALQKVRGARLGFVFQEPATSLDPVMRVGAQIGEGLRAHRGLSRREAREQSVELLRLVGVPAPEARVDAWPHELSGGLLQRAAVAMALACEPALLVADEPTSALDATVQAQVLELFARLRRERGLALLVVTHDLRGVARSCDEIAVMYAGRVVERAPAEALFESPRHPYTAGLLASLPGFGTRGRPLRAIPGAPPDLARLPSGCRFRDRCARAEPDCAAAEPALISLGVNSLGVNSATACFHPLPAAEAA